MSMPNEKDYYLIVDLEATCSEDTTVPRDEMEIIEIGAVMLNARNYEPESEFQVFVRPVRHPHLTPFCRQLTGIRQEDVDAAVGFANAMEQFRGWMDDYRSSLFCSWGDYDRKQFARDCEFHNVAWPFGPEHMNLKRAFARATRPMKEMGVSLALRYLGLSFKGSPHRGLDDARNTARIVQQLRDSI